MSDEHPIRRQDVQAAIERETKRVLSDGDSGTVVVEFNYKDGHCISFSAGVVRRQRLHPKERA